jgi:curved DNA-binding protein
VESQLELTLDEAYRGTKKQIQFTLRSTCPSCQGTGAANQQICRTCSGTGGKTTVKSLDVNIPAFVMEGNKIRLKGQGGEGSANGIPGDLLLTITILPNALFTRSGSDLETVIKIRPDQAVLGCSFPVPTMDGEVMLTIPPMVHNGKKLRLKSKGWTQKNGSRGDEIVKVMIDIPLTISSAEKEIYRRLADLRSDAPKS